MINMDKGLEKLIDVVGAERVEELLESFGLVMELLYGEEGGLAMYPPFEGIEIENAEEKLNDYLKSKLNFNEDYDEQHFIDICRRLVKTYENNEILELRLFFKVLRGVSGFNDIDFLKYFNS